MNAFKSKPIINFEPFINLGFVPTNSRKEEYIEFVNEGHVETAIELKHDRNSEIILDTDRIELGRCLRDGEKDQERDKKPNRKLVKLTYEYIVVLNF